MWGYRQPEAFCLFRRVAPGTQPTFATCSLSSRSILKNLCRVSAKHVPRPGAFSSRSYRRHMLMFPSAHRGEDAGSLTGALGSRDAVDGPENAAAQSLLSTLEMEAQLELQLRQLEGELMRVQLQASSQVDGAREELQESRRKAELLEAIVTALRERLRREEDRNAALEAAVEAGRVELARSEGERRELQQRIAGLRSELVEAQTKLSVALRRAADLETRVVRLAQQNASLALRVGELEEQMREQTSAAERAAGAARDRLRALEAAADEDQILIVKLQAQIAEREAQLTLLRDGESELQEVLERSKAAAAQLGDLLTARDEELQRLRNRLAEAELHGSQEAQELKHQLVALKAERDEEVAQLEDELQVAFEKVDEAGRAASEREQAHRGELEELRQQLQDAKIRAEQSSARRVAEVSELRSALEQQLGIARQEALDARTQLATVKEQLDGVLSQEFLQLLEDELRNSIIRGYKSDSAAAAAGGASSSSRTAKSQQQQQYEQELCGLDSREAALRHQLQSLSAELTELQSAAVARLGPALVARAQELEEAAGRYRQVLRDRQAMKDEQGAARASQQLEAVTSELGSLYRLVMSAEARDRERAMRAELQSRELELRTLMEKRAHLLEQKLLQPQQAPHQTGGSVASAASSGQAKRLRQAVNARVQELVREREQQLMQQAATREQQLQAQLQARLAESRDAQQRELKSVQETVAQQMRLMEKSWKGQLDAFTRSLQEAAAEKERLAVQAGAATGQVRQQLTELETLRRELSGAQTAVVALRRAAEDSQATAAQQSAAAAKEVQELRAQVQQLQNSIDERERQYAASAAATAAAAAATNGQSVALSPWPVTPPQPPSLQTASNAVAGLTTPATSHSKSKSSSSAAPALEPIMKQQQQPLQSRCQPGQSTIQLLQTQQQQSDKQRPQPRGSAKTPIPITVATANTAGSSTPNPEVPQSSPQHQPNTETDLPSADAAEAATVPPPLTPIRRDWPAQFGGVVPMVSSPRAADEATATRAGAGAGTTDSSSNIGGVGSSAVATNGLSSSREKVKGELRHKTSQAEGGSSEPSEPLASLEANSGSYNGSGRYGGKHGGNCSINPVANNSGSGSSSSGNGVSESINDRAVLSVWSRILASATQMDAGEPPPPPPPQQQQQQQQQQVTEAAAAEPAAAATSRARETEAEAGEKVHASDAAAIGRSPAAAISNGSPRPDFAVAVSSSSKVAEDDTDVAAGTGDGEPQNSRRESEQRLPEAEHKSSISEAAAAAGSAAAATTTVSLSPDSSVVATTAPMAAPPESFDASAEGPQPCEQPQLQPQTQVVNSFDVFREQINEVPGVYAVQSTQLQPAPPSVPPPAGQWQQQSSSSPPPPEQPQPGLEAKPSLNRSKQPPSSPPSPLQIVPPPSRQSQQSSSASSATSATASRSSSPAAAAMAAAAGAAAAAKRAAALEVSSTKGAAPRVNAPPISEWGRPKPPPGDAPSRSGPAVSDATGLPPGDRSLTGGGTTASTAPFLSEAELGAEIAAIAQSLLQRTIGGGGSSATAAPAASPGGAESAPPPRGASSNLASPVAAEEAAPAPGSSALNPSVPRKLSLVMAAHSMSALGKGEQGSEDAYFMVTPSGGVVTSSGGGGGGGVSAGRSAPGGALAGVSVLGVADGVGGWVEANVDPGQYSREVVDAAARAAEEIGPGADPRQLLAEAQAAVRTIGSCTACVAVLGQKAPASADNGPGGQVLSIANLGDSGCRVVRRASLVLATSAQEHQFNMPYQMAHLDNLPDTDTASDAQMYQISLRPGDVIVLATDGLFDNMWDEELVSMVAAAAASIPPGLAGPAAAAAAQSAAQQLSSSLVAAAFRHAQDPGFRSPWAVELANQPAAPWLTRLFPRGGRVDDITVVVAFVVEGNAV
ncbi:hypothetical protein VaNZ11_017041 [Volvox africanus]|uniref:PPM-type phosphatase domain-containing protein n=1 Tax=Volvox africanus TaxID=51714 RepID=A0ABQ5SRM5_9CHLO|nr:hypothetical protein VaNZ11_017041 [Volvox africanus]